MDEAEEFEFRRRLELERAQQKPSAGGLLSSDAVIGGLTGAAAGLPIGPLGILAGGAAGALGGSALASNPESKGFLADYAGGIAETLTTGAIDAAHGLGRKVGGVIRGAITPGMDMAQGRDESMAAYADSNVHKVLEPQTSTGQTIADLFGQGVEWWNEKMAEVGSGEKPLYLPTPVGGRAAKASPEIARAIAAAGTGLPDALTFGLGGAASKAKVPDIKIPEIKLPKKKADTPKYDTESYKAQQESKTKPGKKGGDKDAELAAMQDAEILERVKMAAFADDAAGLKNALDDFDGALRQTKAQEALDARQAAMEFEVKRRTTLEMQAAERARQEAAPAVSEVHKRWVAEQEKARLAQEYFKMQQMRQMEIDDTPHVLPDENRVIADQYGGMQEMGRIDENGMPIRADRSMEAQHLQEPLQRNLWGDELPRQAEQESLPLTQAIDSMGPGPLREQGLNLLRGQETSPKLTSLLNEAVDSHPFVRTAQSKVDKASEALLKAQDLYKNGKATAKQVARAERDLTEFERRLDITKRNVEEGQRRGTGVEPMRWGRMTNPGGKQRGAVVFNGSPYRWKDNRPDSSHIGKGEGNQSFGWGLYWGSKRETGESYVKSTTHKVSADVGSLEGRIQVINTILEKDRHAPRGTSPLSLNSREQYLTEKRFLEQELVEKKAQIEPSLYAADLPDSLIEKMLDWDKPLEQHPSEVQAILKRIRKETGSSYTDKATGETVYELLGKALKPDGLRKDRDKAVSLYLAEKGIPGNKYLDGVSRKNKEGSYNYVTFPGVEKFIGQVDRTPSPLPWNKQRGSVILGSNKTGAADVLNKMPWSKRLGSWAPSLLTPEEALERVRQEKDIEVSWKKNNPVVGQFTAGGAYVKAKNPNNTLIRYAQESIMEADRLGRAEASQKVHEILAPQMRALKEDQLVAISDVLNHADLKKLPLDMEGLQKAGFTPEMTDLITSLRKALDESGDSLDIIQKLAGKEPIDRRVSYLAIRAAGDFRAAVYDKKGGEIVGMLGSNRKGHLESLVKEAEKKGLFVDDISYMGASRKDRGSAQQAFMQNMIMLADGDPRLMSNIELLDSIYKDEAYSYLNRKTHTMDKKGIPGMSGRKPWQSPWENAKETLENQLMYIEAIAKWRHLSEAAEKIRPLLTDKTIDQPHAKRWVEDYMKQALGFNPSEYGHAIERATMNAFGITGLGYSYVKKGQAAAKQVANGILLGLDPMFWLLNEMQVVKSMPGITAAIEARAGFPISWSGGVSYLADGAISMMKRQLGKDLSPIEKQAYDYAKTHHVYGSDMMEHSNRIQSDIPHKFTKTTNWGAQHVESQTRENMYMAFVHMLNKQGMKPEHGLFETSHNLVDYALGNYSRLERSNIFNTMGPLGDVAANLQKFKYNELSRLAMYAKMAKDGESVRPLITELIATAATGGVLGLYAFQDVDTIIKELSKLYGKPTSLTKLVMDADALMAKTTGSPVHLMSHGLGSLVGLDLTKRMGMGNAVADSAGEFVFNALGKLYDIGAAWTKFFVSPTEMKGKAAVAETLPRPLAGMADRAWFSSQQNVLDAQGTPTQVETAHSRKDLEPKAYRNTADKFWKTLGATGVNESYQKDINYENTWMDKAYGELRMKALNQMKEDLFLQKDISPSKVKAYIEAEGDLDTLDKDIEMLSEKLSIPEHVRVYLQKAASDSITSQLSAQRRGGK